MSVIPKCVLLSVYREKCEGEDPEKPRGLYHVDCEKCCVIICGSGKLYKKKKCTAHDLECSRSAQCLLKSSVERRYISWC